jgi:hypothetical protein
MREWWSTALCISSEHGNPLWTSATDINDVGDIVGQFRPEASEDFSQGFLGTADGQVLLIGVPHAVQSSFTDINNLGALSGFMSADENLVLPLILTPMAPGPNTFFEDEE